MEEILNESLDEAVDVIKEDIENKQFVTFYINEECFGFNMEMVQEIIWVPETVYVPLTPPAFLGLANLRGSILPVLDLRIILNQPADNITESSRVIIINLNGQLIGLLVDKVDRVIEVEPENIEGVSDVQNGVHTELLEGVVKHPLHPSKLVQILDGEKIIEKEFVFEEKKNVYEKLDFSSAGYSKNESDGEDDFHQLVSFYLDNQEFGIEIFDVKEIIRFPEEIHEVPNTDSALMGIISYREEMLPLINLDLILGLKSSHNPDTSRVLVLSIKHEGSTYFIGLVVDKVREILKVSDEEWEALPELFSISSNQCDIKAICRLNGGKRIVSVLSTNNMLQHPAFEVAVSISQEHKEKNMEVQNKDIIEEEIQLVIFKLQNEEYGIFIEHIQEIILIPEEINVVPKTPDYIEGMINLRGSVLPVIDMRKRLGLPQLKKQDSQRIIVLNTKGVRMGFIVDSVVEVLCVSQKDVEEIPKMSGEQAELLDRVINLKDQNRIILVINVEKLLQEEQIEEISTISEKINKEVRDEED